MNTPAPIRILDHLAARILSAWFSASDLITRGVR